MSTGSYYRPIEFSDLLAVMNCIGSPKKTTPLLRRVISINDCLKFGATINDLISISRPIELTQRCIDLNSITERQKFGHLDILSDCINEQHKSRLESRDFIFISEHQKIRLSFEYGIMPFLSIGGAV